MSLLAIKLISILLIFLTACGGAVAALRMQRSRNADLAFTLGSLFGGGVFLGAGFIHMLPDSVEILGGLFPEIDYPLPYAVAALGLIAILAVDRLGRLMTAGGTAGVVQGQGPAAAMILLLVLSFHSILAGAAIGAEDSAANSIVLLLAILAHKGSAAFALTTSLLRGLPDRRSVWPLVLLFSVMTPLGLALGALLRHVLAHDHARVAEGLFDAVAAATFVYVATLEVIGPEFRSQEHSLAKLGALTLGLAVMAAVALWL